MFLTGEFARIARVSKRMLQYYDEIGLLHPAHTDNETGYRYYSASQLPTLNRILALKDLGLTLQQIAQMLSNDISDEEIQGMLLMQKLEIEKRVQDDIERLRRIESRLNAQQLDEPDVVIKSMPPLKILSVNHFCLNPNDGFRFIAHLLKHMPAQMDMKQIGHFIALADIDDFINEHVDLEFGFLVEGRLPKRVVLDKDTELTMRMLPAVPQMATLEGPTKVYEIPTA